MPARTRCSTMPSARLLVAWRLPRWDPAWRRDLSTFELALIRLSGGVHHTSMQLLLAVRSLKWCASRHLGASAFGLAGVRLNYWCLTGQHLHA